MNPTGSCRMRSSATCGRLSLNGFAQQPRGCGCVRRSSA
jgi:hypothetical protein